MSIQIVMTDDEKEYMEQRERGLENYLGSTNPFYNHLICFTPKQTAFMQRILTGRATVIQQLNHEPIAIMVSRSTLRQNDLDGALQLANMKVILNGADDDTLAYIISDKGFLA